MIILLSYQFPQYMEKIHVNPLNDSMKQNYRQLHYFPNMTKNQVYSDFKSNVLSNSMFREYKNFTNFEEDNRSKQERYLYNLQYTYKSNYSNSKVSTLEFSGYYIPSTSRGYMEGCIPYRRNKAEITLDNDSFQKIVNQMKNSDVNYPTEDQIIITDEDINKSHGMYLNDCRFKNFFNISKVARKTKDFKYLPDYGITRDEATKINDTHEFVAHVETRIISRNCATDIMVNGSIYNNAAQTKKAVTYSICLICLSLFSILVGLRLLLLSNSPARIEKMSLFSFIMQCIYDFMLVGQHLGFAQQLSNFWKPQLLISSISLISAVGIDLVLILQIYMTRQIRNGGGNNVGKYMILVYLAAIIYMFVNQYIPDWVVFVFVLVAQSYWFIQSVYAVQLDLPKKFLPLDYLIVQTLVKYAPVAYNYAYPNNFMEYEVKLWNQITMGSWFGLQILIIFVQYIFGGRLGFKPKTDQETIEKYDYSKQNFQSFIFNEYEQQENKSVTQLLQLSNETKLSVFQLLVQQKRIFVIPFISHVQEDKLHGDVDQKYVEIDQDEHEKQNLQQVDIQYAHQMCMNPLHDHSLFYNSNISILDLPTLIPAFKDKEMLLKQIYDAKQIKCFYIVDQKFLQEFNQCTICIDNINLDIVPNKYCQCVLEGLEDNEAKLLTTGHEQNDRKQEIWITPCGHAFHSLCIGRWGAENQTCPADRKKIPDLPTRTWWE